MDGYRLFAHRTKISISDAPTGRSGGEWKVWPDGNNGIMRPAKTVPYGTKTRSDVLVLSFLGTVNAIENFHAGVLGKNGGVYAHCFFPCGSFLLELFSATANDQTCCAAAPPPDLKDTYKGDQQK